LRPFATGDRYCPGAGKVDGINVTEAWSKLKWYKDAAWQDGKIDELEQEQIDEATREFEKRTLMAAGDKMKWCDRDGCVPADFICSAVSMDCPKDKPLRCRNWQCAATKEECPTEMSEGGAGCTTGHMAMCPDGQPCETYPL
jgi:predicted metal-binding protein